MAVKVSYDYKIISSAGLKELEKKVQAAIDEGYRPQGSLAVSTPSNIATYIQPMLRSREAGDKDGE